MVTNEGFRKFLHVYPQAAFLEARRGFDDAEIVVLGVPLDLTGTYRPGYRFGPNAIRAASTSLEYFSVRLARDLDGMKIADIGDIELSMDMNVAIEQIRETVADIISQGKVVVVLGGEHTVSLACLEACDPDALVVFDAHLDCRDMYKDLKVSHATWLRRASERHPRTKVVHVGSRASTDEERHFVDGRFTVLNAITLLRGEASDLNDVLMKGSKCWVSFDMDVFDPAFAPAVGNPEPEGVSPTAVFDLIQGFKRVELIGFDVSECVPGCDHGQTSSLASKLAIEMCALATFKD